MKAPDPISGFPLAWPDGWPRTASAARVAGAFKVSFARARDDLLDELRLGDLDDGSRRPVISANVPLRRDGLPYARPVVAGGDPGVALYCWRDGRPLCLACDRFADVDSNLRAIGLTVHHLRMIARYGTGLLAERAYSGFAALPAPGEQAR